MEKKKVRQTEQMKKQSDLNPREAAREISCEEMEKIAGGMRGLDIGEDGKIDLGPYGKIDMGEYEAPHGSFL